MMVQQSTLIICLFSLCGCIDPAQRNALPFSVDAEFDIIIEDVDQSLKIDLGIEGSMLDASVVNDRQVSFDMLSIPLADMSLPQDIESWLQEACEPAFNPLQMGNDTLESQTAVSRWSVGGALGDQQVMLYPNQVDQEDHYEIFSIQGGTLKSTGPDGMTQWKTETTDLEALRGIHDFDGDGVAEILASSSNRVHLFRLSNGQELWQSTPQDIGLGQTLRSLSIVDVSENPEELYPSLYIADKGCSSEGTGFGVVYQFPEGFEAPVYQAINIPRLGGRCSRWQSLLRLSPIEDDLIVEDDLLVMLTDIEGLHGFSAKTGERIYCGQIIDELQINRLPYAFIEDQEQLTWIGIVDDRVSSLTVRPYQESDERCDESSQVISSRWQTYLTGASTMGFLHFDLNGDGEDELWVNHIEGGLSGSTQWRTGILDGATGDLLGHLNQGAVLGQVDWSIDDLGEVFIELLVSLDMLVDRPFGEKPSSLQLIKYNVSELRESLYNGSSLNFVLGERLWEDSIPNSVPIWKESRLHDTTDFKRLELIKHEDSVAVLLSQSSPLAVGMMASNESTPHLIAVDHFGLINRHRSEGGWGTIQTICSQSSLCQFPDRVFMTGNDGRIRVLDSSLEEVSWTDQDIRLVTGWVSHRLTTSDQGVPLVITQSRSGSNLSVFEMENDLSIGPHSYQPRPIWSQQVTTYYEPGTKYPNPPLVVDNVRPKVVVANDRRDPSAIDLVGFSLADGEELWRHRLLSYDWQTEKQRVNGLININGEERNIIYRLERAHNPDALNRLPPCEGDEYSYTQDQIDTVNPQCPDIQITPRVIHALDAGTGECIWRTILSETNICVRGSSQILNLVDIDHDGDKELYLFESSALRRLNPATGELVGTAVIPQRPDGHLITGGWLKPHLGGLLRFGTYSPPDLYELVPSNEGLLLDPPTLNTLWAGDHVDGLRSQSWLFEWVASTSTGAWVSLGLNRPLARYNQRGEIDRLLRLSILDDHNGDRSLQVDEVSDEAITEENPDVFLLKESSSDGLFASTSDGGLFILDNEGELSWGKIYNSLPSRPVFVDWDQDGLQEWMISTSNGELIFYNQQSYLGVSNVWEASCSSPSQCTQDEDVDSFQIDDPICIGWTPIEGIAGADIQIQTFSSGSPITLWQPIDLSGAVQLNNLTLTAPNHYRIAIRGWLNQNGNERLYTEISYSNGFHIIDDASPTIRLTLDRDYLVLDDREAEPLMILVEASDQVQLAGWSLVLYDENNSFIKLIGTGAINETAFRRSESWNGQDRYGRIVMPGRYKLFLAVTDIGGNQTNTELWVTVE